MEQYTHNVNKKANRKKWNIFFKFRLNYSVPQHLFKFDLDQESESEEEDLVDTEEDEEEEDEGDEEEPRLAKRRKLEASDHHQLPSSTSPLA